jgi:hypothetical protein
VTRCADAFEFVIPERINIAVVWDDVMRNAGNHRSLVSATPGAQRMIG